jgi:hypothetical protein
MSFLSKKNSDMLFDLITEESINVDYASFNKLFLEFGQINGTRHPLMEMNKQFIRNLLTNYGRHPSTQQTISVNRYPEQQQFQNNNISTTMPSRPQGSRSKNVSFDEQLELHKQHFQQYASPPPPTPPVFKDEESTPSSDLEILMKKALGERNYDSVPPQQNPRKIHIGSVIEDEKHKEDLIDIDILNKPQPLHQPPPQTDISNLGFFSKLKTVKKVTEEKEEDQNPISTTDISVIEPNSITQLSLENEKENEFEFLKHTVTRLTQQLEEINKKINHLYNEIEIIHNNINPELKETTPLQSK